MRVAEYGRTSTNPYQLTSAGRCALKARSGRAPMLPYRFTRVDSRAIQLEMGLQPVTFDVRRGHEMQSGW